MLSYPPIVKPVGPFNLLPYFKGGYSLRILSPILNRVIYPFLGTSGYFRNQAGQIGVLTYHGVVPDVYRPHTVGIDSHIHRAKDFHDELRLLKRHYFIISPEHFLVWLKGDTDLPKGAVLLTCDDGLLNTITDMLPILEEEQVKCLFFVTGVSLSSEPQMLWYEELYLMLMDSEIREFRFCLESAPLASALLASALSSTEEKATLWWNLVKELSRMERGQRATVMTQVRDELGLDNDWKSRYLNDPVLRRRFALISAAEVHQLVQSGMSIGSHTLSHPLLAEQTLEMARTELEQGRYDLERALGLPVWALAYPFGGPNAVSEREFHLAESAGYQCAFVNYGGAVHRDSNLFALPRIHVSGEVRLGAFEAHASGFHEAFRAKVKGMGALGSSGS